MQALPCRWDAAAGDWVDVAGQDKMGESEKATLEMLEWSRLCTFVAGFASTSLGRRRLLDMQVRLLLI